MANSENAIQVFTNCMKKNQILWASIYNLYRPANIEIELLLANLFRTDDCQGPFLNLYDQMNQSAVIVNTIDYVNVMSFHRFNLAGYYMEHVAPISCVNVMFNSRDEIIGASLNVNVLNSMPQSTINTSTSVVLSILESIPRVSIALVLASHLAFVANCHSCKTMRLL